MQVTDKAQKLTNDQVAKWEQSWSSSVGRLDMETVGQTWTRAEKDAATNTRALTASAPAPQMLFYRPSLKSNDAMFVKLRLSYRR